MCGRVWGTASCFAENCVAHAEGWCTCWLGTVRASGDHGREPHRRRRHPHDARAERAGAQPSGHFGTATWRHAAALSLKGGRAGAGEGGGDHRECGGRQCQCEAAADARGTWPDGSSLQGCPRHALLDAGAGWQGSTLIRTKPMPPLTPILTMPSGVRSSAPDGLSLRLRGGPVGGLLRTGRGPNRRLLHRVASLLTAEQRTASVGGEPPAAFLRLAHPYTCSPPPHSDATAATPRHGQQTSHHVCSAVNRADSPLKP